MTKISINEVTKKYADHTALDRMCIDIPERCIYGLLGPNGAGKTTLIRILNQITAPDSGEVLINGEKLCQKHIACIGYLPEERGLYKKMKVGEQAIYLAELKGIKKAEAQKRLKVWFDKFEISGWWDKKVEELSKGMQQKIQFITTIIHEPDILIFDEPFSGFDPVNATLLKNEILALRDKGATVIFSTHNMASVEELCDDIALIDKSKVVLSGSVASIRRSYSRNLFEVTVLAGDASLSLPAEFQLHGTAVGDGEEKLRVTLPEGRTANDLLAALMPQRQIVSINELLPSMNDIFVETVKKGGDE